MLLVCTNRKKNGDQQPPEAQIIKAQRPVWEKASIRTLKLPLSVACKSHLQGTGLSLQKKSHESNQKKKRSFPE